MKNSETVAEAKSSKIQRRWDEQKGTQYVRGKEWILPTEILGFSERNPGQGGQLGYLVLLRFLFESGKDRMMKEKENRKNQRKSIPKIQRFHSLRKPHIHNRVKKTIFTIEETQKAEENWKTKTSKEQSQEKLKYPIQIPNKWQRRDNRKNTPIECGRKKKWIYIKKQRQIFSLNLHQINYYQRPSFGIPERSSKLSPLLISYFLSLSLSLPPALWKPIKSKPSSSTPHLLQLWIQKQPPPYCIIDPIPFWLLGQNAFSALH